MRNRIAAKGGIIDSSRGIGFNSLCSCDVSGEIPLTRAAAASQL
jgi:hypothetical protein